MLNKETVMFDEIQSKINVIQALYNKVRDNAATALGEVGLTLSSHMSCLIICPQEVDPSRIHKLYVPGVISTSNRMFVAVELNGKKCYAYISSYNIATQKYTISVKYTNGSYENQEYDGPFYSLR